MQSFFRTFFFIACILAFALTLSCRDRKVVKDEIASIDSIRLAIVDVEVNEPLLDNTRSDSEKRLKKSFVNYPVWQTSQLSFVKAIVSEFNKNNKEITLIPLKVEDFISIQNKVGEEVFLEEMLTYYDNDHVFFARDSGIKATSRDFEKFQGKYFASLILNTFPWSQQISGFFRVYKKDGTLVWTERVYGVSKKALQDGESPYASRLASLQSDAVKPATHRAALDELYGLLAKKIGVQLRETIETFPGFQQ